MKLLSIYIARLTVLVETAEFNPRNQVSLPDFMKAIIERYGFLKFPIAIEEFDLDKGVTFSLGKLKEINIRNVILYDTGTVIETGSSTRDCELIYEDLVQWVRELVGIEYRPILPERKFFLSEVSFQSNLRLGTVNEVFTSLASRVSAAASAYARQRFDFEPVALIAMPDMSNVKIGPTAFRIDRLARAPFEEQKYLSSAPLHTEDHIQLLEEFEKALSG